MVCPRRVLEDPLRFAGVHSYRPGDNARHVHWRATARTGQLQIKEFDPSDTLSLTIAVDVQTLPRTYEYLADALEYVVMAAASIAIHALDEHYMVGVCANALTREAETWTRVRPGRHARQATEILQRWPRWSLSVASRWNACLRRSAPSCPLGPV